MEEKQKSKVLIYIIVVLVLAILIMAIAGIMGYKALTEKINQNNEVKEPTTIDNEPQNVVSTENETIDMDTTKTIQLNGNNYGIKVLASYEKISGQDYTNVDDGTYYNLKYSVSINNELIEGISKNESCKGEAVADSSITKISDENGKEYLLVYTYIFNPANVSYINIYIIDVLKETNKVVGMVSHKANTSYSLNEGESAKFEVNSKNIIDYKEKLQNNGQYILEKHKYTIQNGTLNDVVEKTYTEYNVAGAVR